MTDKEKEDSTPARKEATGRPWKDLLPAGTIAWSVIDHHKLDPELYSVLKETIRRARVDGEMYAKAVAVNSLEPNERRIAAYEKALREIRANIRDQRTTINNDNIWKAGAK